MPAVVLVPADLTPFAEIESAKAVAMIEDAMALAARVAPCIAFADFQYEAAARALIRGAILRWHEAGTGALVNQQAGPFSQTVDTKQQRRGMFWPSEIVQLQDMCKGDETSGAFSIDTVCTSPLSAHLPWCDLLFLGTTCSCGVDIAGYPIFEGP